MKILVVDDENLLVKGIRFNLQNEGYEVITGSDGQEAIDSVREQSPDLVVLDVMMPNMDGLTACRKIREFSDVPGLQRRPQDRQNRASPLVLPLRPPGPPGVAGSALRLRPVPPPHHDPPLGEIPPEGHGL